MSRSDEQLAVSWQSAAIYGTDRRVGEFPRSLSIADLKTGPRSRKAECGSDLRRVLSSVTNLRNLANSQDVDAGDAEHSQAHPAPAVFHRRRYVASNLHDEHIYIEKRQRRKFHYKSYQDLHILNLYKERNTSSGSLASTRETEQFSVEANDPLSASCSDSSSSRASSPAPRTPTDQRTPNEAKNAKLRRAHARQVQVIEQRQEHEQAEDEDEGEEELIQMQATVLDRPGKPRLIQIQRPRLSDQFSKQDIPLKINPSDPTTPVRDQHEVSSFSPYDTPASGTPFSDLSRTASEATPVPRKQPRLSLKTQLTMLQSRPLDPIRRLSEGSTGTVFSTDERQRRRLADPFGSPFSYDSTSLAQNSPPESTQSSTGETRSISEKSQYSHIYSQDTYEWKLDHAISSTSKAIEAHAIHAFHLDSPELSPFRTNRLGNSLDSFLVSNLNKIFPQSSHSSLTALGAWLIVDQHYSRLFDSAPPKVPSSIDNHVLPELDSSRMVRPSQTTTIVQAPWTTSGKSYSSQPRDLEKMSNISISSPLYTAQIPSKAASLLGIHTDPAGCKARPFAPVIKPTSRSNTTTIEDQARSVHTSVQEVGRSLVRKLIAISTSSSPESITKQRGLKMMHMRGRSTAFTNGNTNGGPCDDAVEGAVKSLWEACCCVASTL